MKIGNKEFEIGRKKYIMGVLNITPDSFSDGGKYFNEICALRHAEDMVLKGADIVDIGFESTRPNSTTVSEDEELNRLKFVGLPVIKYLVKNDIPVSVDTYKSPIAEICAHYGVSLINDIWGFKKDKNMAKVCHDFGIACCIMHNKEVVEYDDFLNDVISELNESLEIAIEAGISKEKIILDPGIGFAKTRSQDLALLKKIELLAQLGYPLLVGVSKKRIVSHLLDVDLDNRSIGTLILSVIVLLKGSTFVRVHDCLENKMVCEILNHFTNEL